MSIKKYNAKVEIEFGGRHAGTYKINGEVTKEMAHRLFEAKLRQFKDDNKGKFGSIKGAQPLVNTLIGLTTTGLDGKTGGTAELVLTEIK